jgi:hypothetical protein
MIGIPARDAAIFLSQPARLADAECSAIDE